MGIFVKKTSNFGQYFGRFEKLKINGPHFASISHPQSQPFYSENAKIIVKNESSITFFAKTCHFSVKSHSFSDLKSFTSEAKVVYFRSQSRSF